MTQLRNDLAESRATELALRRECVELASQSHALVDSAKVSKTIPAFCLLLVHCDCIEFYFCYLLQLVNSCLEAESNTTIATSKVATNILQ